MENRALMNAETAQYTWFGIKLLIPKDWRAHYTSGEIVAKDVLCLMLYDLEETGQTIPPASSLGSVQTGPDEFATLVACDTVEYRKLRDNRAVKKTLSIPAWLNAMAERDGINFSGVLQEALKQKLHIRS